MALQQQQQQQQHPEEEVYLSGTSSVILSQQQQQDQQQQQECYYNLSCSSSGFSSCPGGGDLPIGSSVPVAVGRVASLRAERQWRSRCKRQRNLSQVVVRTRHQETAAAPVSQHPELTGRLSGLSLRDDSRHQDSGFFSPSSLLASPAKNCASSASSSTASSSNYSSNLTPFRRTKSTIVRIRKEQDAIDPDDEPKSLPQDNAAKDREYESQDLCLWMEEEEEEEEEGAEEVVWRCPGVKSVPEGTRPQPSQRRRRKRKKKNGGGTLQCHIHTKCQGGGKCFPFFVRHILRC